MIQVFIVFEENYRVVLLLSGRWGGYLYTDEKKNYLQEFWFVIHTDNTAIFSSRTVV